MYVVLCISCNTVLKAEYVPYIYIASRRSCRGVQVSVLKAVPVSYVIHTKVTSARISKTKTSAYVSATGMEFINLGGVAGGRNVPN